MSLRYNVRQKRREIRRDLKPLENYLLDDILEGTVNTWNSKNKFNLKQLAAGLGIKVNRVYSMLKDLHARSIIIREPTDYPGLEVLGLNQSYFGQILTNHQNDLEKKKHLRLVDNSHPAVDNSIDEVPNGTQSVPNGTASLANRDQPSPDWDLNSAQHIEIIDEKIPLDSYSLSKDLLKGKTGTDANALPWDQGATDQQKARAVASLISGSVRRI